MNEIKTIDEWLQQTFWGRGELPGSIIPPTPLVTSLWKWAMSLPVPSLSSAPNCCSEIHLQMLYPSWTNQSLCPGNLKSGTYTNMDWQSFKQSHINRRHFKRWLCNSRLTLLCVPCSSDPSLHGARAFCGFLDCMSHLAFFQQILIINLHCLCSYHSL